MQFQRISPTEFMVQAPVEEVREAAWYALRESRVANPIIDAEQNFVVGSTGDGFLSAARSATAQLIPQAQGTTVVFNSKPVLGGTIDFGAGKKASKKLADALERILNSGFTASGIVEPMASAPMGAAPPPIALATGGGANAPFVPGDRPVYGKMLAPKRGTTLLSYAVIGILCCQFLSVFTIIYSIGALRDYKVKGDPGDKGLVVASLCLGVLGCLIMVLNIALRVGGVVR
ncbi:hypothetical protein IAD21_01990 [Abditibacteriota bacterium]|nr:hypothetical protein IAD21_01990 [Abditibacteriota bacterium]